MSKIKYTVRIPKINKSRYYNHLGVKQAVDLIVLINCLRAISRPLCNLIKNANLSKLK